MDIRIYKDKTGVKIYEHVDKCLVFITSISSKKVEKLHKFWESTEKYGVKEETFDDFLISFALLKLIRKEWNRIGQPKINFKSC